MVHRRAAARQANAPPGDHSPDDDPPGATSPWLRDASLGGWGRGGGRRCPQPLGLPSPSPMVHRRAAARQANAPLGDHSPDDDPPGACSPWRRDASLRGWGGGGGRRCPQPLGLPSPSPMVHRRAAARQANAPPGDHSPGDDPPGATSPWLRDASLRGWGRGGGRRCPQPLGLPSPSPMVHRRAAARQANAPLGDHSPDDDPPGACSPWLRDASLRGWGRRRRTTMPAAPWASIS